jgi:hypothetical protein
MEFDSLSLSTSLESSLPFSRVYFSTDDRSTSSTLSETISTSSDFISSQFNSISIHSLSRSTSLPSPSINQSHQSLLSLITRTFFGSDSFTVDAVADDDDSGNRVTASGMSSGIFATTAVFLVLIGGGVGFFLWRWRHEQIMTDDECGSDGVELTCTSEADGDEWELSYEDHAVAIGSEWSNPFDFHSSSGSTDCFIFDRDVEEGFFDLSVSDD